MKVLGLKIRAHDTGAALITDQKIVAIAEERLNRIKHSTEMFPVRSIIYCLETLRVRPEEIDLIVIDQIGLRSSLPMPERFYERAGGLFSHAKLHVVNHHDAHAASAFFASPYEEAAILVYDGAGEAFETHFGVVGTETETLYRGMGTSFEQIQKTLHAREVSRTRGIGKLYSYISREYLGFGRHEEGKMMGLAPYGKDIILQQFPREQWFCEFNGHIVCNRLIHYPQHPLRKRVHNLSLFTLVKKASLKARNKTRQTLRDAVRRIANAIYNEPLQNRSLTQIFSPIILPRPPRNPKLDRLPDEYYSGVAYAVQKVLEDVAVAWGKKLKNITGSKNLCVAGGVGLNIDANKKFFDEAGFENVFIQPACSDTGIALGCALYGWHVIAKQPRFYEMKSASLGRSYSEEEIKNTLKKYEGKIIVKRYENIAEETASILAKQHIIGWFYGGAEYGPRALGNRSILCDARGKDAKDTLNNNVKHREPWRPFAASVLLEDVPNYFEFDKPSPFMLFAVPVRKEKQKEIPAVTHVDGTCRIQSVTKEANGRYYDLISAFKKITGTPLILNTSFNLGGDPIVETPSDALECFLKTKMDYLVLENYLVAKKSSTILSAV